MDNVHPNDIELLEYFEGEADPTTAETIHRHVEGCGECSELITLLAAGRGALASSPELELSRDRLAQTLDSLGPQEPRPKPQWLRPRRLVAVLAPVAAVVALVTIVSTVDFGSSGDDTAAPAPAAAEVAPGAAELRTQDQVLEADDESQFSGEAAAEAPREPAATSEPTPDAAPESPPDLGAGISAEDAAPPASGEESTRAADAPPVEEAAPAAPSSSEPTLAPEQEPSDTASPAVSETKRPVQGPAEDVARLLTEAGFSASVNEDGMVEVASADLAAVEDALASLADGDVAVVLVSP